MMSEYNVFFELIDNEFLDYVTVIDVDDIIGFISNETGEKCRWGKPVMSITQLMDYEFDYIVLWKKESLLLMRDKLVSIGIPEEKIVNWTYYLFAVRRNVGKLCTDIYDPLSRMLDALDIRTIGDIEQSLYRHDLIYKSNNIFSGRKCFLYEGNDEYDDHYYQGSMHHGQKVDAIVFLDPFLNHTAKDFFEIISRSRNNSRYVFFTIPYPVPSEYSEWHEINLNEFGEYKIIPLYWTYLVFIDKESHKLDKDVKIYTVTHKKFYPPINPMYIPIHVGDSDKNEMKAIRDNNGDSISDLNPYLNECTALYWIWKNTNDPYVGLNHYRRYFVKWKIDEDWEKNLLDGDFIKRVLSNVDIIVGEVFDAFPHTQKKLVENTVDIDKFEEAFTAVREKIGTVSEQDLEIFDEVFNGYTMFPCQMFVMKRPLLEKYCEWLFGILLPVIEQIDFSNCDVVTKRTIGYIAERMLSVFIKKKHLMVKEIPWVQVDTTKPYSCLSIGDDASGNSGDIYYEKWRELSREYDELHRWCDELTEGKNWLEEKYNEHVRYIAELERKDGLG